MSVVKLEQKMSARTGHADQLGDGRRDRRNMGQHLEADNGVKGVVGDREQIHRALQDGESTIAGEGQHPGSVHPS